MTTHVTLTDVMVDELVARAQKAEARVTALEAAISEVLTEDAADEVLRKAADLQPTEQFLQKVRAL